MIKGEAAAYLRFGLLSPAKARIARKASGDSPLGVLFVPGLGANSSQFLPMRRSLEGEASWFGGFDYFSLKNPKAVAEGLLRHLHEAVPADKKLVVVGHSLGGLILRIALQSPHLPSSVVGFAAICSPLQGTWTSRFGISPGLRGIRPDSPLIAELHRHQDRLYRRFDGRLLTVSAGADLFIRPADSAHLPKSEQLCLDGTGHVASLLSTRCHEAVRGLLLKTESYARLR